MIFILNLVLSINISFSWYKQNTKCFVIEGVVFVEEINENSNIKNVMPRNNEYEIKFYE